MLYVSLNISSDFFSLHYLILQFQDYANEIIRSSVNNARNSNLVLQGFSRSITSLSLFANITWPLLTIPHYETRASDYIKLTKAESLAFAPLVGTEQREEYENYTVHNQGWIEQGLIYEYEYSRLYGQQQDEEEKKPQGDYYINSNYDLDEAVVNREGFSVLFTAKPI